MKVEAEHDESFAKMTGPNSQKQETQYKTTQESSEKVRSVKKIKTEEEDVKSAEKKSPKTTKDPFEFVLNEEGKRIGKKDAKGNFVPYKKRGRPQKPAANAGSSNTD